MTTTSLIYVDDLKIVSGPDDKDLINDEKYIFAGITANNYIVGNLQPSTKYLYHVRADIGNVYSDDSQIITVVTKDNYSSIEKLTDDKSKVTVKSKTIQISSKRGDNLQVYTTSGILVKSILADSELTAFQLPKGFFIVKTEQWSEKIVITTTY